MAPEPTVYAVDDDIVARILLEETFRAANLSVETYASAEEFLAQYDENQGGCLLLDIIMPGMDGLELQRVLSARGDTTPVVFLSGADDVTTAVNALKAGAMDFIEKPIDPSRVIDSVRAAISYDFKARYERMKVSQIKQRYDSLTVREQEVMRWVVSGKNNKVIANILNISSRTVEVHRRNVIKKMEAESLAELVQMAMQIEE
ncbi:response regulator transcription factor [Pseudohalioglobus lutimaris]|uniref:DNA-binding response regulator n=1 Tax=Pseudohalioglobus lutimaris TaxID=1737061 RepID=A0A2N5X1C4_9GAMM|nr:response regulator [Pseudohalioglobus lutimaris]PLW68291.1 DNA-binding response regulator [Pseudohalioglobus lutimaris]